MLSSAHRCFIGKLGPFLSLARRIIHDLSELLSSRCKMWKWWEKDEATVYCPMESSSPPHHFFTHGFLGVFPSAQFDKELLLPIPKKKCDKIQNHWNLGIYYSISITDIGYVVKVQFPGFPKHPPATTLSDPICRLFESTCYEQPPKCRKYNQQSIMKNHIRLFQPHSHSATMQPRAVTKGHMKLKWPDKVTNACR